MRIIAVINQKGGVGKTTTTVNLGHALALRGKRVLVVDMDPQGHLATCLGVFRPPQRGVDEVLTQGAAIAGLVLEGRENLALLPSGIHLERVEQVQEGGAERARMLQRALRANPPDYDLMLFDCPPMFGILVANVLMVADLALIPVNGDYLSLNGLAKLLATIKRFEPFRERPLELLVLLSRFHLRRRIGNEVIERLEQHLPGRLLTTAIRESTALTECPSMGRTIFEYRNNSVSAQDFMSLAEELLNRGAG